MAKIAAIVVVYNSLIKASPVASRLKEEPNVSVTVFDNSDRDFGNREACADLGWEYLGGAGNLGLARAYNAAIDSIKSRGEADIVCFFDQDTCIKDFYFNILESLWEPGYRIYAPLVYSRGKLISPCRVGPLHSMKTFKKPGDAFLTDSDRLSAINSGMAVSLSVFDDYRYDENIFLDGLDHAFLAEMKALGERICVLPTELWQGFSAHEHPEMSVALARFKSFKKDYKYILRNEKPAYLFLVSKRAARLCWEYKTLSFI